MEPGALTNAIQHCEHRKVYLDISFCNKTHEPCERILNSGKCDTVYEVFKTAWLSSTTSNE